jgi:hypothetical protein
MSQALCLYTYHINPNSSDIKETKRKSEFPDSPASLPQISICNPQILFFSCLNQPQFSPKESEGFSYLPNHNSGANYKT